MLGNSLRSHIYRVRTFNNSKCPDDQAIDIFDLRKPVQLDPDSSGRKVLIVVVSIYLPARRKIGGLQISSTIIL